MRYALIGAGAAGSAIARHFARAGMPVAVANSRGPESLKAFAEHFGDAIRPTELASALKADMVILAIPFASIRHVLQSAGGWGGRIVVDAPNAIDAKTFEPVDLRGRASSEIIADLAPGAKVVKGFNHILARILARDPDDGRENKPRTLFISSNDEDAKAAVAGLMSAFGFEVIDLGQLSKGGLMHQYGGPLAPKSLGTIGFHGSKFADIDINEQ